MSNNGMLAFVWCGSWAWRFVQCLCIIRLNIALLTCNCREAQTRVSTFLSVPTRLLTYPVLGVVHWAASKSMSPAAFLDRTYDINLPEVGRDGGLR